MGEPVMQETMDSPVGRIALVFDESDSLISIDYSDEPGRSGGRKSRNASKLKKQLREFFSGNRTAFDVEFEFHGTDFQVAVWKEIAKIPYGKTITYGDIAKAIGKSNSSRAVGAACGQNPFSIIVPCHRVVGAGGRLTGYAGGLWRKSWLLDFESGSRKLEGRRNAPSRKWGK
jgi:methylated-DNA-[protein]-cysteine S-methyltransferase